MRFWGLAGIFIAVTLVLAYSSCGGDDEFNFFEPIAQPIALDSDRAAKLEEARILIDREKYEEASDLLDDMIEGSDDSNEARLLFASAKLGEANLDVWSIISNLLEDNSSSSNSDGDGGVSNILDAFDESLLGTGSTRDNRVAALDSALETLQGAPDKSDAKVTSTACLFAGMLAVPLVSDATTAIQTVTDALNSISQSASNGGQTCPDIDLLDEGISDVQRISASFTRILTAVEGCPFIDLSDTTSSLNSVESQLNSLTENADKGCDNLPTCPPGVPNCNSIFPQCVQEVLEVGTSSAEAGDDQLASCEIVLHCTTGSACFE